MGYKQSLSVLIPHPEGDFRSKLHGYKSATTVQLQVCNDHQPYVITRP